MSTLDIVAEVLREVAPRVLRVGEIVEMAKGRLPSRSKTPEVTIRRNLAVDIKRNGDRSAFTRVGRGYIALNPKGDPDSFKKLTKFAHARHLALGIDTHLKSTALNEAFFEPYAISSCALIKVVYANRGGWICRNGTYLTIEQAEAYLAWLRAGNLGYAGQVVTLTSKWGRFASVETRAACGTYTGYSLAVRERGAGRSNCGPCDACTQARRDYENDPSNKRRKELIKTSQLKRSYGVTLEEKLAVLAAQGGCCAVCHSPDPRQSLGWCIDHNHATRDVRGVVCPPCNHLLGNLGKIAGSDDPDGPDRERLFLLAGPAVLDYLRNGAARTTKLIAELRSSQ